MVFLLIPKINFILVIGEIIITTKFGILLSPTAVLNKVCFLTDSYRNIVFRALKTLWLELKKQFVIFYLKETYQCLLINLNHSNLILDGPVGFISIEITQTFYQFVTPVL